MSAPKKTNPLAVLDNLPDERQAAILAFMDGPPSKTYAECKSWLASDGVKVSENLLSNWRQRYLLRLRRDKDEAFSASLVDEIKADAARAGRKLSEDQLFRIGQLTFGRLAIEREDSLDWQRIQKLRQQEERRRLDRDKLHEQLRTKLQAGLDAVADAFRTNPEAMELYQQARAMIDKQTE